MYSNGSSHGKARIFFASSIVESNASTLIVSFIVCSSKYPEDRLTAATPSAGAIVDISLTEPHAVLKYPVDSMNSSKSGLSQE